MTTDSSASVRDETPHANQITRTATILNSLKRRAQAVLDNSSIDPQSRAIIRYAMEINDPGLAELVRRADAGDTALDTIDFSQTPDTLERDLSDKRVRALASLRIGSLGYSAARSMMWIASFVRARRSRAGAERRGTIWLRW